MAGVDRRVRKRIQKKLGVEEDFNHGDLKSSVLLANELNTANLNTLKNMLDKDISSDLKKILDSNHRTLEDWKSEINALLVTIEDVRFKKKTLDLDTVNEVITIMQTTEHIGLENKTMMDNIINIIKG